MQKIIVILMCLICTCGCTNNVDTNIPIKKTDKVTEIIDNTLKEEILNNLDQISNVADLSSSNPYDYIDNEYYDNIVALGEKAIPVLESMYKNSELTGVNAYIGALAIEEITGSRNFIWSDASEFFLNWEQNKKEE